MLPLTVITINLNNARGLKKSIESVITQTCVDFEYIVIDGASTDGSVDIIKQNADKIDNWISEPDAGIYNAMNKGIKKARGEYLLFLNSGDYLYSDDTLKKVFSLNFNEDLVYGDQFIKEGTSFKKSFFLKPEYISFNSFQTSTLPHQCTFIKRQLFNTIGLYNEENSIVSDWEWNTLALFKYNCTIKKINIPIAVYDQNGISNNSALLNNHRREKRKCLEKNFPRIITDSDNYFHLLKRYKKIPRWISALFNKIK